MNKRIALLLITLCFISVTIADEQNRKCIDGKRYYDGCNNCFCANGNVACTLRACIGPDGKYSKPNPPPEDFWAQKE